jgi:hypothetical protein
MEEARQQRLADSLDSLHKRLGLFFDWASQLQAEFRDLKQRVGVLEQSADGGKEQELIGRLKAAKINTMAVYKPTQASSAMSDP